MQDPPLRPRYEIAQATEIPPTPMPEWWRFNLPGH